MTYGEEGETRDGIGKYKHEKGGDQLPMKFGVGKKMADELRKGEEPF